MFICIAPFLFASGAKQVPVPREGLGGGGEQGSWGRRQESHMPLPARIYTPWAWPQLVLSSHIGLSWEMRIGGSQTMKVQTRLSASSGAGATRPPRMQIKLKASQWKREKERVREKLWRLQETPCSCSEFAFIWKQLAPPAQIKSWHLKPNWRSDLALLSCFLHFRGLPGLWALISCISRNPRRWEARPSLCPFVGHPPSELQLLQVNDALNIIQGWA